MAKAARLPKLKWKKDADANRCGRDAAGNLQWIVFRSRKATVGATPLWGATKMFGPLYYAETVDGAKAIAQAFADAETLRGEGG